MMLYIHQPMAMGIRCQKEIGTPMHTKRAVVLETMITIMVQRLVMAVITTIWAMEAGIQTSNRRKALQALETIINDLHS